MISWSWGDLSVFPLVAMASGLTARQWTELQVQVRPGVTWDQEHYFTEMSDEFLRGVDNLQQLLEELVGEALLHG